MEELSLTPKQVETLLALIGHSGEIVRKDVLMSRLWENTVVEESNLIQNIHFLRKFLGETADGRQMIETLRRRGYRFNGRLRAPEIAPTLPPREFRPRIVSDVSTPLAADLTSTDREKTTGAKTGRIATIVFAAAGVLAVVVVVGYLLRPTSPSTAAKKQFAVLPLKPIDPANRSDLLENGVADALINRLNSTAGFVARPLSSTRGYTDIAQDPLAAGREQKVDYVLAGNYQSADGKIRITTQLYNVSKGEVEETYAFEKELAGVFAIQDAMVTEVSNKLVAKFGTAPGQLAMRGTDNEEAYRYYLLAQNFNEQRGLENGRKALERIEQAVALDPNFARAWATKAYIHRYIGYGAGAHEHYMKSMEAVEKALAIDPNLSEAHSTLCFNKFRYEYDFVGAESACKRALALDPNSPLAHKLYSNFLYTRGRFDESFAEIKKAIDLQPVSYDNQQTYALALYFARKYDETESQWKQLIRLNPNHSFIYGQLVRSLAQQGKESEAFDYLIEWLRKKESDETIERFRTVYAESGWQGVTLERIRLAEARENPAAFELARFYAAIRDKDKAFSYLERSYQERSNMIAVLRVDPELDSLREDPRYVELLRRVENFNGL